MSEPLPEGEIRDERTIFERMAAIQAEMPAIGKTQENVQQKFLYRGHDDVLNALNPLLAKHGVIVIPRVIERVTAQRTTKSGSVMYEVNLCVAYDFYGLQGDSIFAVVWGEGTDTGDKATSKALTMAFKQAVAQSFAISTGEFGDPDAHTPEETTGRQTRRREGAEPFPVPQSWPDIEKAVRQADNPEEAWALFQAFIRACSYQLFGEPDSTALASEQRVVVAQKAAGAAVWLNENVPYEGADFRFFDEEQQRKAWAHVLDGVRLEIPDYVAPEPEHPQVDEEAERLARETLGD